MKALTHFWIVVLLAMVSCTTVANSNSVILKADRLLHVESGQLVTPGVLVIEGDKIAAVNPDHLPDGVKVIELGNTTLLPGLIDMHTHLSMDLEGDWTHAAVTQSPADNALRGVRNARKTLLTGFTTVRDLGASGFADVALMRAVHRGFIDGPDIFPSAHALGITGGHCDVTGLAPGIAEMGPREGVADGKAAVLQALRYQIKQGAKVIKVCATAGVMSMEGSVGAQQYSNEELNIIVAEARRQGIKVAAHAHGSEGILAAVEAGVNSIEHGTILNQNIIRAMKKRDTFLVPTVYLIETFDLSAVPELIRQKAEIIGQEAFKGLQLAIREQVPIAYGTDAGVFPHGDNGKQFAVLVKHGMSSADAIRSATVNAATLLGVNDRGRIAAGLRADVIAVAGNPLTDIRAMEAIQFVMKAGSIYTPATPAALSN